MIIAMPVSTPKRNVMQTLTRLRSRCRANTRPAAMRYSPSVGNDTSLRTFGARRSADRVSRSMHYQ